MGFAYLKLIEWRCSPGVTPHIRTCCGGGGQVIFLAVLVAVLVVDAVVCWVWCPVASSWGASDQCVGCGTSLSTTVAAKTVLPALPSWWVTAGASKEQSPGP